MKLRILAWTSPPVANLVRIPRPSPASRRVAVVTSAAQEQRPISRKPVTRAGKPVSARTAVRVVREGWLSAVVRLTWKPLLGALACAVALGGAIDYFVPDARSLPHAAQLLKAQDR